MTFSMTFIKLFFKHKVQIFSNEYFFSSHLIPFYLWCMDTSRCFLKAKRSENSFKYIGCLLHLKDINIYRQDHPLLTFSFFQPCFVHFDSLLLCQLFCIVIFFYFFTFFFFFFIVKFM